MNTFIVTYDIWTDEDLDFGDTDDKGIEIKTDDLHEAMEALMRSNGLTEYITCRAWGDRINSSQRCIVDGTYTHRALHRNNITNSSWNRICAYAINTY